MPEDADSCMGCVFRLRFGFRRALYEQLFLTNKPLVDFVRKLLGIKGDGDVARMMRVFLDVDIRGTHKLDIETFFDFFGIEFSEYNMRAFRLLATGDSQEDRSWRRGSVPGRKTSSLFLTFDQFFVSMYNYGTLLHEALVRFAFDVMASGKEFCNRQDVISLVSLLHSERARVKDTVDRLMEIMDPHNRDRVSFETFRNEERRLGSMLFPAFKLQKILRAKVIGAWFWRRATKRRRKARLIGADLCREYSKLKAGHLESLEAARQRRRSGVAGTGVAVGAASVASEEGAAEGLKASPTARPGSDDEGYRPEGGENGGGTESRSSSSSSSGSDSEEGEGRGEGGGGGGGGDAEEPEDGWTQAERRPSAGGPVNPTARRVSYADALGARGSVLVSRGTRQETGGGRRSSALDGDDWAASSRRRSTKSAVPVGGNGRRRSSAALAAVSDQGIPGRRGSLFEGMQVYAPATDSETSNRRRSTRKGSTRVMPGERPTSDGYAEWQAFPETEEGE